MASGVDFTSANIVITDILDCLAKLEVMGRQALRMAESMVEENSEERSTKVMLVMMGEKAVRIGEGRNTKKGHEEKCKIKCRWWNRGYCRVGERCKFDHPKDDCELENCMG